MEELDKRYKKKLLRNTSNTPSKPRVIGDTAVSTPPPDAPKWAIDPAWKFPSQGNYFKNATFNHFMQICR